VDDIAQGSICDVFRQRTKEDPGAIALVDGDRRFSYAELNRLSDTLARRLEDSGVRCGDVVALYMERSAEMIVAMLGVTKCAAAYMPLDPLNPVAHNVCCLDRATAVLVLNDGACDELCTVGRVGYHFTIEELQRDPGPSRDTRTISTEAPAYVMFTSGTTSGPKGVVVPHRAVTRLVVGTNYIKITPRDTILQFSTPCFDASTFEIWGALLNGAKLVLYPGGVPDPNLLKRLIVEHAVTIQWLTAALFHLFADKHLDALRPLKVLLAGGDVLQPTAVRRALANIEGLTLINGYGPTENTTFTCCHVMTRDNMPGDPVPIGKPITGTEIFILNEKREAVADSETGELYAAGRGVALGYLGDKTQDDPFFYDQKIAEGLIYKTGDLVRRGEKGLIEFVGRTDSQVKVRGYRFSLEEIKARLVEIPFVKEVAVICHRVTGEGQLLIAFLQAEKDQPLDAAHVREYLSARVPRYMIPDMIKIVSTLPVNINGKIDTKSLLPALALP
jgi:amino acid adenylation domain-containing protein